MKWGPERRRSMRSLGSALILLLVIVVADAGVVSAQQGERVYKVGRLETGSPGLVMPSVENWIDGRAAYRDALRDTGLVVGKNLIIETRHAEGDLARLPTAAEALVASKVDVITSGGTSATVAAMQVTKTIPIVF